MRGSGGRVQALRRVAAWGAVALLCGSSAWCAAQENPLGDVHTTVPAVTRPKDADAPDVARKAAGGSAIHVNVNLVLVPVSVTDPMNRLVTGLDKENFEIYDNNTGQTIKSFATEDAPISIGIVFDLSGSMQSKFVRARKALSEFLRTSNPQDEFFVVGFNDRPAVLVDYTSDVEDVEARMVMLRPQNRTALIDAMYLAVNKLRGAKYDRRALLVISDGGDNRSRYTEGELSRAVRESEVQIFSIGIFDHYAPTEEEQNGPVLLKGISEATGGRLFQVLDLQDLADIAERISEELRDEYVIGYTPSDRKRDGSWRKLKVRLLPPPGLPVLTAHNREGYYAPSQ
jgi:Ca-activated chloride channel family protein